MQTLLHCNPYGIDRSLQLAQSKRRAPASRSLVNGLKTAYQIGRKISKLFVHHKIIFIVGIFFITL